MTTSEEQEHTMTTPEELNLCQDCHERRDRPPVIDYPTNPFQMCDDCGADTDLVAIKRTL